MVPYTCRQTQVCGIQMRQNSNCNFWRQSVEIWKSFEAICSLSDYFCLKMPHPYSKCMLKETLIGAWLKNFALLLTLAKHQTFSSHKNNTLPRKFKLHCPIWRVMKLVRLRKWRSAETFLVVTMPTDLLTLPKLITKENFWGTRWGLFLSYQP